MRSFVGTQEYPAKFGEINGQLSMNSRLDQSQSDWKCLVKAEEAKGVRGGDAGYLISETSEHENTVFGWFANGFEAGYKTINFEATSVRRTDSLRQTAEPQPNEIIRQPNPDTSSLNPLKKTRNLSFKLAPQDFSFCPFGSSKPFETIELSIYPLLPEDEDIERCFISAWHHSVYDDITLPRSCFFKLQLKQERFDEIWTTLLQPCRHSISFGISHPALHHEWDPIGSYRPSLVKLLLDDQEVAIPDGKDLKPLRIADDVATFDFSVAGIKDLEPWSTTEDSSDPHDDLSDTYEDDEEPEEPELSFHQSLQEVMIAFWNVHGARLADDILFIKYGVYLVAGLLALLAFFNL